MRLRFDRLFTGSRWKSDWLLEIDDAGMIVAAGPARTQSAESISVAGIAIPGFVNVHGHAFQRALAGLSEHRFHRQDSFWTWRRWMYRLVELLTPEDELAIARQLYWEMLRAGYTTVAEFHYVHQQPGGRPYDDPLAMSAPLVAAADEVGIQLTLLPVLYQHAGFGPSPLAAAQQRFVLANDAYVNLVRECHHRWKERPGISLGLAAHSLRAVHPETLAEVFPALLAEFPSAPAHIHIAEQIQEVTDCVRSRHRRPVELLLDHCDLNERWCLIHATHLAERELTDLVDRKVVVGLCPSTEANLGDGVFLAADYCRAGGRFAIGSDSHVTIDPRSELRWLEYAQRLTHRARSVLCDAERSVGRFLCEQTWHGGRQALCRPIGRLEVGDSADFLLLDPGHPSLIARDGDRILDGLIFCEHGNPVDSVYVRGQRRWPRPAENAIEIGHRYRDVVRRLSSLLV